MFLRIKTRYPKEEVERLIRWVEAQGFDLTKTCVNVRNTNRGAMGGRAYSRVPREYSNAPRTARYLVTLRLGPAEDFPYTNVWGHGKWVKVSYTEYEAFLAAGGKESHTRGACKMVAGVQETWMEIWKVEYHAYGGKSSPVYTCNDWKEGLVALAAHEFTHILQFRNKTPRSEIRCEKAALRTLEAYRELLKETVCQTTE